MSFALGIALKDVGWHPHAWRLDAANARRVVGPAYAAELAHAVDPVADLVTWEDPFGPQNERFGEPDPAADGLRGVVDPVLVASSLAPLTTHVGLVPTVVTTHTEPFHVAKAVATLDHLSGGRAGVRIRVDGTRAGARLIGRRDVPPLRWAERDAPATRAARDEIFAEAVDVVEVLRRLWDSWEDDAEIRDAPTGRFIDRERLHYADFEGSRFSVKGPLITPRPPQGQPPVFVLAHDPRAFALAATSADVVLVTPGGAYPGDDAAGSLARARAAEQRADRSGDPLRILADLTVVLASTEDDARTRHAALDSDTPWRTDTEIFVGTPTALVDRVRGWADLGFDGVRLRPATHAADLPLLLNEVLPRLREAGLGGRGATLRERLALTRPVSRYAATRETTERVGP